MTGLFNTPGICYTFSLKSWTFASLWSTVDRVQHWHWIIGAKASRQRTDFARTATWRCGSGGNLICFDVGWISRDFLKTSRTPSIYFKNVSLWETQCFQKLQERCVLWCSLRMGSQCLAYNLGHLCSEFWKPNCVIPSNVRRQLFPMHHHASLLGPWLTNVFRNDILHAFALDSFNFAVTCLPLRPVCRSWSWRVCSDLSMTWPKDTQGLRCLRTEKHKNIIKYNT